MALKMTGLQRFRDGLDEAIDLATFDTARDIQQPVRELSPVDEGDLQSSARIDPDAPNGSAEYAVKSGGVRGPNKFVDYAAFVEADQPFFQPAVKAIDRKQRYRERLAALAARSRQ